MNQSSKPRPDEEKDDHGDDDDKDKARPEELLEDCWFFSNLLHRKLTMSSTNSCNSHLETMSSCNLALAPSLPATAMSIEDEEIQDEEIEFSMGKLIRQASLKNSDIHAPKSMTTITSCCTSPRKMEFNKLKLERLRPRRQMNQLKTQKSLSDLQSKELQGFKDLGFDLGQKNLKQELKRIEEDEGRSTSLPPYHSEAQDSAPPPAESKWGGKRSTEDDMKAQIKFWARAVASNCVKNAD